MNLSFILLIIFYKVHFFLSIWTLLYVTFYNFYFSRLSNNLTKHDFNSCEVFHIMNFM